MFLKTVSLLNYKNFESKDLVFDSKINCFVGDNGKGKTNILDAIYHLSFGKSYFNPIASQNIKHGADFFVVEGIFEKEDREEKIVCSLKRNNKKIIKRNGKAYDRFADHIGLLPFGHYFPCGPRLYYRKVVILDENSWTELFHNPTRPIYSP